MIPECNVEDVEDILSDLHVGHPGIVRMKALPRMHVWWPNLDQQIETLVKECLECQFQQPEAPKVSNAWIWPNKPWTHIHVDFAGPFENSMFLIVVDTHSKWMKVMKMEGTSLGSTINALRCLFASYGLCQELVTDNGPQFTSEEMRLFLLQNGIKHIKSPPYDPASNGEAERAVRT